MKYCPSCDTTKEDSDYHRYAKTKDGLQPHCKACKKAHQHKVRNSDITEARRKDLDAYYKNFARRQQSRKKYNSQNLCKGASWAAKRRAVARQATPVWSCNKSIQTMYAKARRLSLWLESEFQVDHIVPLNSDLVCGFHTEDNLQILPKFENLSKNNRRWPDMWES